MIGMLNLDRQHASIREELDGAIDAVIVQSEFVGGTRDNPFVREFECEFAGYVGVKHCIGVGSGTDAIRIVLEAVGIVHSSYDDVYIWIPANTAYPVAEAVKTSQGEDAVRFVDCDPVTYTVKAREMRQHFYLEMRQHFYLERVVMVNHQYGHPCDMDAIRECTDADTFLIEDCSHAHGARYKGRNVGTFGNAAVFSFNPTKILGAMGDAGCIVTDDDDLAQVCRQLADHGRKEKYTHDYIGWNSRMDGVQAAVLSVKLKHLDEWVERRRDIASLYIHGLLDLPGTGSPLIDIPVRYSFTIPDDVYYHSYHQFVVRVQGRDAVRDRLREKDIQTNIHYPLSLPEQPALAYLGVNPDDFIATKLSREILSLPINESMTDEEVEIVCEALKESL